MPFWEKINEMNVFTFLIKNLKTNKKRTILNDTFIDVLKFRGSKAVSTFRSGTMRTPRRQMFRFRGFFIISNKIAQLFRCRIFVDYMDPSSHSGKIALKNILPKSNYASWKL